jgi:hypothetical protein
MRRGFPLGLRSRPSTETVFGRIEVQLLTCRGRLVDWRLSETDSAGPGVGHVSITGDLPR